MDMVKICLPKKKKKENTRIHPPTQKTRLMAILYTYKVFHLTTMEYTFSQAHMGLIKINHKIRLKIFAQMKIIQCLLL